jgi:hypothetical protein
MLSSHIKKQEINPTNDETSVCFMPSPFLISNLTYEPVPPLNLPTLNTNEELKSLGITSEVSKVSYSAIATATETLEATVIYVLKQIMAAVK